MFEIILQLLYSQLVTLAAQFSYAFAFRPAFERQIQTLRERPAACFGWGLALSLVWTALGFGAFYLAAAQRSAAILMLLSVPTYLAVAAGGAVCLAAMASRATGWAVERHPFRCIAAGQVAAILVASIPRLGALIVALYASAGLGAVLVTEFGASGRADPQAPKIGRAGLLAMLVLTIALTLGLLRAGRSILGGASSGPVPELAP